MQKTMAGFWACGLLGLTLQANPVYAGDTTIVSTAVGAALGGLVGSNIGKGAGRIAATGAGVFLGGVIGNNVGHSMESADRGYSTGGGMPSAMPYYQSYRAEPNYVGPEPAQIIFVEPMPDEAMDYAAPPVYIEEAPVGPQPARHGSQYRSQHRGQHCREFTQTIRIDNQYRETYGTACLRPDGSWQIVQ